MEKVNELELALAHLTKTVDELNEVVTRQDAEIRTLTARVKMLMAREAEREAEAGAVVFGDEAPPPHY